MKKYIIRIMIILVFAGIIAALYFLDIHKHLTWENLNARKEQLDTFVQSNYILTMLSFIGIYIVATAVSIPAASMITMAGGYMFGFAGVAYVNVGATIGATLVFLAARYVLGGSVQKKYADKLVRFNKEIEENGKNYLLTLRLIPVFPFWFVNLAPAFTKVPFLTFIWTTALGIIPGSFGYVYVGRQLGNVRRPSDLLTWQFWLALGVFGIIAMIPVFIKKISGLLKKAK